jgi:hypothetical protein
MINFIVLGLIPGTNITISFTVWFIVLALFPYFHQYLWRPVLADKVKEGLRESYLVLMWSLLLMPSLHHWPPYAMQARRQAL